MSETTSTRRGGGNTRGTKRTFGSVRKLPSGRFQARYTGPDGQEHRAGTTFQTKTDANTWLSMQSAAITESRWKPPAPEAAKLKVPTFRAYATEWLAKRELKPRTRDEYRKLIGLPKEGPASTRQDKRTATALLDAFGDVTLEQITPEMVDDWHAGLDKGKPTHRAHLYALLRTILGSAVGVPGRRGAYIETNPCNIRGAGRAKRARRIEPATLPQLAAIADGVPERWSMLVQLAAWCALRFGETTELRRRDVDLDAGVLRVRRGVTWIDGEPVVGPPKSDAGARDVAIPPHLIEPLRAHLADHAEPGPAGLLFPAVGGGHLAHGTFHKHYRKAREAAGRPDLRLHDLRHTGAVFYAQVGATTKELMVRLGHTTPTMAMNYQHAAAGRDAALAAKLSQLAGQ